MSSGKNGGDLRRSDTSDRVSRLLRANIVSASESHEILHKIISDFQTLAATIEHAINALAEDESGTINVAELERAKQTAERGASIARNALSNLSRAFD